MSTSVEPRIGHERTVFAASEFRRLAGLHLLDEPSAAASDLSLPAERGDHDLNPDLAAEVYGEGPSRLAAVLVPLVPREDGLAVILTRRTEHLSSHAGQIAFPGGKVEKGDQGPLQAALRETREEIGIASDRIEPLGYLDTYQTRSGFRIVPVVAFVDPHAELVPDPGEVAAAFEVPLSFLMTPANHRRDSREWRSRRRYFYAMPFREHHIWGVTAGIIRNLYERVYGR
ncbi:CoA pyrophosphatase [Lutibaculum baratangense]|uniref:Putative nudix hydrolase YeaB n=1 Tax=Lutibaculum baratangense AMV1 TaxID=631454 RepID=V4RAF7_9HYPH|nr:CoA pyrophosphatase [Lutibaculum baratangense]ESR23161.1 putative nudix hydrolase YeaB [Lutibaculum baratangense AMV1]